MKKDGEDIKGFAQAAFQEGNHSTAKVDYSTAIGFVCLACVSFSTNTHMMRLSTYLAV